MKPFLEIRNEIRYKAHRLTSAGLGVQYFHYNTFREIFITPRQVAEALTFLGVITGYVENKTDGVCVVVKLSKSHFIKRSFATFSKEYDPSEDTLRDVCAYMEYQKADDMELTKRIARIASEKHEAIGEFDFLMGIVHAQYPML